LKYIHSMCTTGDAEVVQGKQRLSRFINARYWKNEYYLRCPSMHNNGASIL